MTLTVLGIETSCDETAAAVVRLNAPEKGGENRGEILSNIIASQIDSHAPFGGVVPEIAARQHIDVLDAVIAQALTAAKQTPDTLNAIVATAGPGLIGGVMVGLVTGKSMAMAAGLPFIGVNHLEAHALTARLETPVPFPYLLLLVSGGHCQLISVDGLGQYRLFGSTRDDAVGEAFDKAAKLVGLAYPGGPEIERAAQKGNGAKINLPRPLCGDGGCDFSFSGLKTALRRQVEKKQKLSAKDVADLAAAFQTSVTDCLIERSENAMAKFSAQAGAAGANNLRFVLAGGVAANQYIRQSFARLCQARGFALHIAAPDLCTDNAAMVAWAGAERLARGQNDFYGGAPRARWPLGALTPPAPPTPPA